MVTKKSNENLPVLTYDERMANLKHAVDVRAKRAEVKRQFHDGKITMIDLIDASRQEKAEGLDQVVGRLRVYDLLQMIHGVGPIRAEEIMRTCHISARRRIGGLGRHQAETLIQVLNEIDYH